MRILITGANGFIGRSLSKELAAGGHNVTGIDRTEYDLRYETPPVYDQDVVVHLAALPGRLFGEQNVYETVSNNAGATAALAKACGKWGVRLVYTSTSEAYGEHHGVLVTEDDPMTTLPYNLYGLSKLWGEEVSRLYAPNGLQILRPCMPYGPDLPYGWGRAAIMTYLHNALVGEPLTVHYGAARSWCYISDAVRAIRVVIESGTPGIYNIGRDDDLASMLDVARMAVDLAGADRKLIEIVDPPQDVVLVKRISTEKIRALGWKPVVSLEDGMRLVLERMHEAAAA